MVLGLEEGSTATGDARRAHRWGGRLAKKQKGNCSYNLREPTLQGMGAVVGHWQSCPLQDWQSSKNGEPPRAIKATQGAMVSHRGHPSDLIFNLDLESWFPAASRILRSKETVRRSSAFLLLSGPLAE